MADQPMYVRLPVELHAAIKADAERNERTMAQTIRYALRRYLAEGAQDLGPVERGSVLHVADSDLTAEDAEHMRSAVAKACGHDDFVIVATNGWADMEILNEERMAQYGWVRGNGTRKRHADPITNGSPEPTPIEGGEG